MANVVMLGVDTVHRIESESDVPSIVPDCGSGCALDVSVLPRDEESGNPVSGIPTSEIFPDSHRRRLLWRTIGFAIVSILLHSVVFVLGEIFFSLQELPSTPDTSDLIVHLHPILESIEDGFSNRMTSAGIPYPEDSRQIPLLAHEGRSSASVVPARTRSVDTESAGARPVNTNLGRPAEKVRGDRAPQTRNPITIGNQNPGSRSGSLADLIADHMTPKPATESRTVQSQDVPMQEAWRPSHEADQYVIGAEREVHGDGASAPEQESNPANTGSDEPTEENGEHYGSLPGARENAQGVSQSITHGGGLYGRSGAQDSSHEHSAESLVPPMAPAEKSARVADSESIRRSIDAALVAALEYPELARRRGHEGNVTFSIVVDAGGSLIALNLTKSSGSGILDAAATRLFRSVFAQGHALFEAYTGEITIKFRLATR